MLVCLCTVGKLLPSSAKWQQEEGQGQLQQTWPILVEKLGEDFKTERTQKTLTLPCLSLQVGEYWQECLQDWQTLGPLGASALHGQKPAYRGRVLLGCASVGTSPWDAATLCSTPRGSRTASILSP